MRNADKVKKAKKSISSAPASLRFKLLLTIPKRDLMPYTLAAKEGKVDRNSVLCASLRAFAAKPAQVKDAVKNAQEDNGNTRRRAWKKRQTAATVAAGAKKASKPAKPAKPVKAAKKVKAPKAAKPKSKASKSLKPVKGLVRSPRASAKQTGTHPQKSSNQKRSAVKPGAHSAKVKGKPEVAEVAESTAAAPETFADAMEGKIARGGDPV